MDTTHVHVQVTMVSQQEVPFLKERGVKIIDIRPAAEFDRAHLQDSLNIQFYRAITGEWLQRSQSHAQSVVPKLDGT